MIFHSRYVSSFLLVTLRRSHFSPGINYNIYEERGGIVEALRPQKSTLSCSSSVSCDPKQHYSKYYILLQSYRESKFTDTFAPHCNVTSSFMYYRDVRVIIRASPYDSLWFTLDPSKKLQKATDTTGNSSSGTLPWHRIRSRIQESEAQKTLVLVGRSKASLYDNVRAQGMKRLEV